MHQLIHRAKEGIRLIEEVYAANPDLFPPVPTMTIMPEYRKVVFIATREEDRKVFRQALRSNPQLVIHRALSYNQAHFDWFVKAGDLEIVYENMEPSTKSFPTTISHDELNAIDE